MHSGENYSNPLGALILSDFVVENVTQGAALVRRIRLKITTKSRRQNMLELPFRLLGRKKLSHNAKWLAQVCITFVKYSWKIQLCSLRLLYESIVSNFSSYTKVSFRSQKKTGPGP